MWQEGSWAEAAFTRGKELSAEDCSEVKLIETFAALERKLESMSKAEDTSATVSKS